MFTICATKNTIQCSNKELLTSGAVAMNECRFTFNKDWDNLIKTAVFKTDLVTISVLLDDNKCQCTIPWEVLETPNELLSVGVYGTDVDGKIVLPTVWTLLGTVLDGANLGKEGTECPTPNVYQQILTVCEQTKQIAQSVRDDADAGEFDGEKGKQGEKGDPGYTPKKGIDYYTPTEKDEFIKEIEDTLVANIDNALVNIIAQQESILAMQTELIAELDIREQLDEIIDLQESYIGGDTE